MSKEFGWGFNTRERKNATTDDEGRAVLLSLEFREP